MNFTPDMLAKVLDGTKTQTRRPAKAKEEANHWRINGDDDDTINEVLISRESKPSLGKWAVGHTYAVCPGRGKKAVARIRITEIRHERPIDISEADARAEGFADREGFFAKWRSLYGEKADLTQPVWVLTFQLVSNQG